MAQPVRVRRGRKRRDQLPGIVDQAHVQSTSTQIQSSVQHGVGLLDDTLVPPRRPSFIAVQSAALGGGLAVWQLPARPREVAGVAVRVALEVVLVLGLGLPERDGLADLGHHLAGPQA
jgi:hypothetical protein